MSRPLPGRPAALPPRPRPVGAAITLYLVVLFLQLLVVVLTLLTVLGGRDAAVLAGIVADVLIGAVLTVLYAVALVHLRRGANWARLLLAVLSASSALGAVTALRIGDVLVLALGALAVLAAVLLFLPASNAWFRAVAEGRQETG